MIQVSNLKKTYARDRIALDGVSFTVAKGEFVYLTGPSGSGKSTLLRLLYGAERPGSGQITVNGINLGRSGALGIAHLRRKMGLVFQDFKLLPGRNLFDNVALPLEIQGKPRGEIGKRAYQALHYVGLDQRLRRYPLELSGGEQQRAAIARALVGDPLILLADEPTGNLDPENTAGILELFKGANARGTTVLMATHDQEILQRFPRRMLVLSEGRLTADVAVETGERHGPL